MPKVSVIMPCFNHSLFVGESIEAVLAQTFSDLELIVIDDCSRDGSRKIIEKYERSDSRVRAIYHEANLGASRSRNDGIKAAKGAFLAFCDADDVWMPVKLERQLELLEKNPSHDVAYCDAAIINELGRETGERFSDEFPVAGDGSGYVFNELCLHNFVNMQTVLIRRECIRDGIDFDERIKWVEDWLFWVRIAYRHSFIYTKEALAKYRVHQRSTARVQRSGRKVNRIKVFHRILRYYPEIPSKAKSDIYYHIGVALSVLGKQQFARRFFSRAVELERTNFRALCRIFVPSTRVQSCQLQMQRDTP